MTMMGRHVDGFFRPRHVPHVRAPSARIARGGKLRKFRARQARAPRTSGEDLDRPAPRVRRRPLGAAACLALALLSRAGTAHAAEIRKGPYLQALGQKGVTMKLELATPEVATLDVTGPAGFHATHASASAKRFHAIRVEGLTAGTTYTYRLRRPAPRASPARSRRRPRTIGRSGSSCTATAAPTRRRTRRSRASSRRPRPISSCTPATWCRTATTRPSGRSSSPSRASSSRAAARSSRSATTSSTAPDPAGQVNFLQYFASTETDGHERPHLYGSFRWSNTRFFLLNAMDTWTGDEREWLRAELSAAINEPGLVHRIAVLHHGPFSSGRHGGNPRLASNGIVELLRDAKVDLVLAGHDHVYERGEGQGLKYVISGGAGAPLYTRDNRAPETLYFESVHHYLEVAVDGEKVSVVARRASGSVIETCSYAGAAPWSCAAGEGKPGAPSKEAPSSSPAPQSAASSCACGFAGSAANGAAFLGVVALGGLAFGARRGGA